MATGLPLHGAMAGGDLAPRRERRARDPAGRLYCRFVFETQITNFPDHASSARELEKAVADFLSARVKDSASSESGRISNDRGIATRHPVGSGQPSRKWLPAPPGRYDLSSRPASSTSRTFLARVKGVKGFWRKALPVSSTPLRITASSVYPDM